MLIKIAANRTHKIGFTMKLKAEMQLYGIVRIVREKIRKTEVITKTSLSSTIALIASVSFSCVMNHKATFYFYFPAEHTGSKNQIQRYGCDLTSPKLWAMFLCSFDFNQPGTLLCSSVGREQQS